MPPILGAALQAAQAVNGERLWSRLARMAEVGATARGGVNRPALSPQDGQSRSLLLSWAAQLNTETSMDDIGNLFIRRPGRSPGSAGIMLGSHLDSQPTGGRYDGTYGVLSALEVLCGLDEAGIETELPIDVAVWSNEEGSRFAPGCMGSAVFARAAPLEKALEIQDAGGITVADALRDMRGRMPALPRRRDSNGAAAYIEAHIEQGPILETQRRQIGIVTGIQGTQWYEVEVSGQEAHAGTTPMDGRRDAFAAAVAIIESLRANLMLEYPDIRITVGRFEVSPGSPNTVPGRVRFTLDIRHPRPEPLKSASGLVAELCGPGSSNCSATFRRTVELPPALFDSGVVGLVDRYAGELGLRKMPIVSGAFHDALYLSRICPTAMIFIPCRDGLSHNEAEAIEKSDATNGARLLAAVATALAFQT